MGSIGIYTQTRKWMLYVAAVFWLAVLQKRSND
jgi:hypothetical protein